MRNQKSETYKKSFSTCPQRHYKLGKCLKLCQSRRRGWFICRGKRNKFISCHINLEREMATLKSRTVLFVRKINENFINLVCSEFIYFASLKLHTSEIWNSIIFSLFCRQQLINFDFTRYYLISNLHHRVTLLADNEKQITSNVIDNSSSLAKSNPKSDQHKLQQLHR